MIKRKKYYVGVCGHFGRDKNFYDGQTIKTKTLTNELISLFDQKSVITLDTHNWKKNPILLMFKCCRLIKKCDDIIILPSKNGITILSKLFVLLNKIYKKKLHYVVIGGWLPFLLETNNKVKHNLFKFDGIYVETKSMIELLQVMGFKNIKLLQNFKQINIISEEELKYSASYPYKLCTFSRVIKEKGIEDAIFVVKSINKKLGHNAFLLDIYGQIDDNYLHRFNELKEDFPDFISYKGIIHYSNTVEVLKDYFLLLFPTHYKTEGLPGTIIDAYSAGIPVLASRWNSAFEIIDENKTGLIYEMFDNNELEHILLHLYSNPSIVNEMKKNCMIKAKDFTPNIVMKKFINYLSYVE